MIQFARTTAMASALLMAIGVAVGTSTAHAFDDNKEIKEAQKDVLELTKLISAGKEKEADAKAAAIKKKYEELNTVMHVYKPSPKGGIGYGKAGPGDGIELKIINMGKRNVPAATLQKEKADLIKLAYINAAMAMVADHYAPTKPKGGKGAKEWKQYSADQKKAAMDMIKAIQAGNAADVKAAANNMNNACNNCHADFRDS
jgi:cytochrome c556